MDANIALLQDIFPGVDKEIIRDVLAGASNSVDEAATQLSQMDLAPKAEKPSAVQKPAAKVTSTLEPAKPFTFAPASPTASSNEMGAFSFSGFSAPPVAPSKGLLSPSIAPSESWIGPSSTTSKTSPSKHSSKGTKPKKSPSKPTTAPSPDRWSIPSVGTSITFPPKAPAAVVDTSASAEEWRGRRGPNRFGVAQISSEEEIRQQEEQKKREAFETISTNIKKPTPEGATPNTAMQMIAAYVLAFGPHLRAQMQQHAESLKDSKDKVSPFACLLPESGDQHKWFEFYERCEEAFARETHTHIPYHYSLMEPYNFNKHEFPLRITVMGVEFAARPPQNRSPLNDLPAELIATIATTCGGNARDLMRFRLISARWARCLRDFHGELRIIGITKEKNKMDLRVMDMLVSLFPLARAVSLDIDSYGVLTRVRLRDLRALMLRCPYAHLRDEELKLLVHTGNLQLLELDNVSDQGLRLMAGWESLRDVRLIDCTSVSSEGLNELVRRLPRLQSLVLLSRLFPYHHITSSSFVNSLCQNTSLTSLAFENVSLSVPQVASLAQKLHNLKRLAVFRPTYLVADLQKAFLDELGVQAQGWHSLLSSPAAFVVSRIKNDTVSPPPPHILMIPPPAMVCPVDGHGELVTSESFWVCGREGCDVFICVGCWVLHQYSPRICAGAAFVAPSYITPTAKTVPGVDAALPATPLAPPGGETFEQFRLTEGRKLRDDPSTAHLTRYEMYSAIVSRWFAKYPPQ